jgi:hypothetical protein
MINPELLHKKNMIGEFCSKIADEFGLWLHPVVAVDEQKYMVIKYIVADRQMIVAFSDTMNLVEHFELSMIVLPSSHWINAAKSIAKWFYLDHESKSIQDIIESLRKKEVEDAKTDK